MKTRSRKGFSAVFLTAILLSFVMVTGLFAEASAGYAAASIAEGILQMAGESLLAEYDRELFHDYGLLGVSLNEELMDSRIRQYAEHGFRKDPGFCRLLRLELIAVQPDLSRGTLLSPEHLSGQIQAYMKGRMVMDPDFWQGISGLLGQIGTLSGLMERSSALATEFQDAKALLEEVSSGEEGDLAAAESLYADSQNRALASLEDLQLQIGEIQQRCEGELSCGSFPVEVGGEGKEPEGTGVSKSEENRILANREYEQPLPSRLLDVDGGIAFSLSGGLAQGGFQENFLLSAYVMNCFDHHLSSSPREDHFFLNEGEYILFGQMGDGGNYTRMKASLVSLRTALNLVHIYTDEVKYQETWAMAVSVLPGPAAPILQFVIALAWAGAEAGVDMERLEEGKAVPFLKSRESWILSLSGAVENAAAREERGSGLTYEQYLFLFLFLTDETVKLVRIMDLIQLNLQGSHDGCFQIKNSCCQVNFTAETVRHSGFFGRRGKRYGSFSISRGYDE